jgi:hypothetical protein
MKTIVPVDGCLDGASLDQLLVAAARKEASGGHATAAKNAIRLREHADFSGNRDK